MTVHGAVGLGDTPARPVSLQATPTLHKEQYVVPLVMNQRAQRPNFPGRLYQILNSPWFQNCNEFLRNNINVYLLLNFTQLTLTCISILRNTPFMLNKRDLLLEKMQMASQNISCGCDSSRYRCTLIMRGYALRGSNLYQFPEHLI